MTSRTIPVAPFDYVVFGGTGDLARRKLLPSLYHRFRAQQIPKESRIIGISRQELSRDEYRAHAGEALSHHVNAGDRDDESLGRFLDCLDFVSCDVRGDAGLAPLHQQLDPTTDTPDRVRAFYLATAPGLFGPVCQALAEERLTTPQSRVVLEKPVGHDLATSAQINDAVGAVFEERQIYRIDHYLGKETVQNLMALRFANSLFEPLWNAAHVDHVQITVAETVGLEGRGGYYDESGALRDMVQNHLLQLLCLVAMEPPASMEADGLRDEKLKVLRALQPIGEAEAPQQTVRGQYRSYNAGGENGRSLPGYREDVGNDSSRTETFVALRCEVANWRWSGVPFFLRTGKRLPKRVSEVVITFKEIPHSAFPREVGRIAANRLVVRLQPDEGVKLWVMIKDPGPGGMRLRHVPLDMSFAETFGGRHPDAYERLLMDVVRGDQTLFMRRDEVEASWSWIDHIAEAWQHLDEEPQGYSAGTWGPTAAVEMMAREGRRWHEEIT